VSPRPPQAVSATRWLLAAVAASLLAACAKEPAPEPDPLGPRPPEEATAEAVWAYLQGADYQQYWHPESFGAPGIHRSRPPHGPLIRVYVNRVAHQARPLGASPLPAGSVIVLEDYTSEPHLHGINVMAKIDGHRAATNDWAFFRFAPSGSVRVADRDAYLRNKTEGRGCIHCHGRTADQTDYLFQPRLAD
jgi:hypothetical protein